MIVFDLECRPGAHKFEGWFASSDDFADQQARGLLTCPQCGAADVAKALMAPRIARKGNQLPQPVRQTGDGKTPAATAPVASKPLPPEAIALMHKLAAMQTEALKSSRFVGDRFADNARAMHYGEQDSEIIHGQATVAEAKELIDEGIAIAPLPCPVIPPEQAN